MVQLTPLDPVCIEVEQWEYEPVTDTSDPIEPVLMFVTGVDVVKDDRGSSVLSYPSGDDEWRTITLASVDTEQDGTIHGVIAAGADDPTQQSRDVVVRRVTSDDARRLSPAGIAQPREVVEAHVLRGGGMLAGELEAAVAADNSVATLVLDTGVGLYVRYSGDWQRLPDDSTSLENLALHPVAAEALPIWDQVDAAAESVMIFDLPRSVANTYTDISDREEEVEVPGVAVTVASVTPVIENIVDLENVLHLPVGSDAAWYVKKRAKALLASGVNQDDSQARMAVEAVGAYMRVCQEMGDTPDPSGNLYRHLVRQAREAGVLNHPAVIAAISWQEWLHPRGWDGKFINKNATIDVWPGEGKHGSSDKPRRAKVKDITKEGVEVEFIDPETKEPTGETEVLSPKRISAFNPVATLKPEGGETPGEGPVDTERPQPGGEVEDVQALAANGSPANPTPQPSTKALADALWLKAADNEPRISELMQKVIGDEDPENYSAPQRSQGKFFGWEKRVKESTGIEQKIERWARKQGKSQSEAAAQFNDALRYTVHYDAGTFGDRTRSAITQLMADPDVAEVRVYNAWNNPDTAYNGVNVEVHMADGTIFEVQFHTPESQEVKTKQHALYKQQRRFPEDSPEWQDFEDQMNALADGLERPEGVDGIVTEDRHKKNPPRGAIDITPMLKDLQRDPKSTSARHLVQTERGVEWSPERQALHDQIIEDFLVGKRSIPEDQEPVFSVLGGGPAAGKSTLVNSGLFPALQDPNAVLVNADEIKDRLPEYIAMLNDPDKDVQKAAAATVHEESSYLAKRLMDAVYGGRFSVVLDGTGDSSPKKMLGVIQAARERGYRVNGYYTTVPTEDAWTRAVARAEKTGRFVPEEVLRGTHKEVSVVLPEIADEFDEVALYDTSKRGAARQLMTGSRGAPYQVQDEDGWSAFVAKADEVFEPPPKPEEEK